MTTEPFETGATLEEENAVWTYTDDDGQLSEEDYAGYVQMMQDIEDAAEQDDLPYLDDDDDSDDYDTCMGCLGYGFTLDAEGEKVYGCDECGEGYP